MPFIILVLHSQWTTYIFCVPSEYCMWAIHEWLMWSQAANSSSSWAQFLLHWKRFYQCYKSAFCLKYCRSLPLRFASKKNQIVCTQCIYTFQISYILYVEYVTEMKTNQEPLTIITWEKNSEKIKKKKKYIKECDFAMMLIAMMVVGSTLNILLTRENHFKRHLRLRFALLLLCFELMERINVVVIKVIATNWTDKISSRFSN